MVDNNVSVWLDGINYTGKLVMPAKLGFLLDETLDEATISLRHVKKEMFPPLTPVEIEVENTVSFGSVTVNTEKKTYRFVVAGDAVEEKPAGSGLYDHDISLVEITKIAECIVVDTNTVTNVIGRTYTQNASPVQPVEDPVD